MLAASYSTEHYHSLLNFNDARRLLDEHHESVNEIANSLREFGLEKDLGVCLLHKHFDISSNELLARHFENNQIRIYPSNLSSEEGVLPYMWRFMSSEGTHKAYPIEFIKKNKHTSSLEKSYSEIDKKTTALQKLGELLSDMKVTNLFGLSLIPQHLFQLEAGQTLIEVEEPSQKLLTLAPAYIEEVNKDNLTQTLWISGNTVSGVVCFSHCTHCSGHCP